MMSLSDDKQADNYIIDVFNTTPRHLDDILNINNVYVDNMVSQLYPSELQVNKANTSGTKAAFLTCICPFLMILFLPKFMIKVTIVNFPFLDGDVPCWGSSLYILWRLYLSPHLFC